MKTILVPTDFSATADNALRMAKIIAKQVGASIHLCHFYTLILNNYTTPESMIPMDVLDDIKNSAEDNCKKLVEEINAEGISATSTVEAGDLTVEIIDLATTINADLIVIGTTGATNLVNKLIGSNALHIMQQATCPVILVPVDYTAYTNFDKIVFADHFDKNNEAVFGQLIEFASKMNVHKVDILRVNTEMEFDVISDSFLTDRLLNVLGEHKAKLNFVQAHDFKEGFDKFAHEHEVDLLVMSTQKKSLLQRIFTSSATKTMALHTKIPMMVFHQ